MTLEYKNSVINYEVSGKGDALVLLHGFLENLDMWNDFVPEFTKSHTVIQIDLLGHGKTDCLGYIHTMEAMAEAVLAVLNHLDINSAKFIGHSMGGYVALALAELQPNMVSSVCLMNSTFEADDNERKTLRKRAIKMAQTQYESLVRLSFANLFTEESKVTYASDYEKALKLALQTPLQGYIAAQEGMMRRKNRLEILKNLKGKKLIIIGEKDNLIDKSHLMKKIEDTTIDLEVLSEGHMSHIENKSDLSYFLKHFIEN
ncbi:MAG: alpha/beta hydrolase [Flavobacteriaceae bacterium]|uniref:alpha/beta fold hydrolase n=1 Tax=Winogradskyella sp. SYSU M77433 TaxID=3042722 RepID=UPI000C557029|nr:alpha/beta hydrolase [Winogradskyella sp. SYSU M77433]MAX69532.1 alpha/beta hydrolase [Flavobacteriaceae bacterium]MDH7913548.1 alpha/beta hydrolase [Winogradskyella sp. SYSU M77433]